MDEVRSRFFIVVLAGLLVLGGLSGCRSNDSRAYIEASTSIQARWADVVERWDARRGDPRVVAEFTRLHQEARGLRPPASLVSAHKLLAQAMDDEQRSFESYSSGREVEAARFHALAMDGLHRYAEALAALHLTR